MLLQRAEGGEDEGGGGEVPEAMGEDGGVEGLGCGSGREGGEVVYW